MRRRKILIDSFPMVDTRGMASRREDPEYGYTPQEAVQGQQLYLILEVLVDIRNMLVKTTHPAFSPQAEEWNACQD
jgi:hypothetical protein